MFRCTSAPKAVQQIMLLYKNISIFYMFITQLQSYKYSINNSNYMNYNRIKSLILVLIILHARAYSFTFVIRVLN